MEIKFNIHLSMVNHTSLIHNSILTRLQTQPSESEKHMLRQMALKRELCRPKVNTLIEDAQRMTQDEAMRILANGF